MNEAIVRPKNRGAAQAIADLIAEFHRPLANHWGRHMKRLLTVLLLALVPSIANASCGTGDACFVGGLGNGGEASDGRAQGFHLDAPSILHPGATATISGTANSGHNTYSDSVRGTLSGTFHGSSANFSGRGTGIFGDFTGQCDLLAGDC